MRLRLSSSLDNFLLSLYDEKCMLMCALCFCVHCVCFHVCCVVCFHVCSCSIHVFHVHCVLCFSLCRQDDEELLKPSKPLKPLTIENIIIKESPPKQLTIGNIKEESVQTPPSSSKGRRIGIVSDPGQSYPRPTNITVSPPTPGKNQTSYIL